MPRPKSGNPRRHTLTFRATDDEREDIEAHAQRMGLTVSELVRGATLNLVRLGRKKAVKA